VDLHARAATTSSIAALLDITERAAQPVVTDLVDGGYIERELEGRRNRYEIKTHLPLGVRQGAADVGSPRRTLRSTVGLVLFSPAHAVSR
jgi:hypothetical protein